jgi:hypothetical protein
LTAVWGFGARERGSDFVTLANQPRQREARLGGIGAVVSTEIEQQTGKESRCFVLGHLQCGGSPTTFGRVVCTVFGAAVVELIAAGDFGKMVAYQGSEVNAVWTRDATGTLKQVQPDGNPTHTARAIEDGPSLGERSRGRLPHQLLRGRWFAWLHEISLRREAGTPLKCRTAVASIDRERAVV